MYELFRQGGPLMWPLLGCSVLALGIFLTKLLYFARLRSDAAGLFREVIGLVQNGEFSDAATLCQRSASPLAKVTSAVLRLKGQSRDQIKTIAKEVAGRESGPLERYLGLLSTIATISPLIGLLGTVLGMIQAFHVIAEQGVGTPATLGGGISQALLTTAAGLSVAIPTILAHRYLNDRMQRLIVDLEEYVLRVVDQVGR
ncbi:MAG: MotA/TolQ/ExbB proton channel family protein [Desulfuromonas sp.]|nr:MAG: MotA/TolQ/ExbB proton channel family protein [Desulfuromonas sp.]